MSSSSTMTQPESNKVELLKSLYVSLDIGTSAEETVQISESMVHIYADLMNDHNPIHVDKETGRKSIFGTNIAHGMLVGGLFGPIIVNQLIGPGAIYRKQSLEFEAPVPIGEDVRAVVTVDNLVQKPNKDFYTLRTECFLADGKRVIAGEAVIVVVTEGLNQANTQASA